MRELPLGLVDPPDRRYLYVMQDDQGSGSCWYLWDHETKTKTHIAPRGLAGYITGLRLHETKAGKFGKKWKLDVLVDAGFPYGIRTGVDTVFARGLILSLVEVTDPEVLKERLTICVKPSPDNPKVVYSALYRTDTSQVIKWKKWDKEISLVPLIRNLQTVLGDGDYAADESSHDEEDDDSSSNGRPAQPPSSGPARAPGAVNESTINELKRVAVQCGLIMEGVTPLTLDYGRLNNECRAAYGCLVGELTQLQAVEFRRKLLTAYTE